MLLPYGWRDTFSERDPRELGAFVLGLELSRTRIRDKLEKLSWLSASLSTDPIFVFRERFIDLGIGLQFNGDSLRRSYSIHEEREAVYAELLLYLEKPEPRSETKEWRKLRRLVKRDLRSIRAANARINLIHFLLEAHFSAWCASNPFSSVSVKPLGRARDLYFFKPATETLEVYLATAKRLRKLIQKRGLITLIPEEKAAALNELEVELEMHLLLHGKELAD